MKKSWSFCLILAAMLFLTGCSEKFEPTESTVFVTSKGVVHSAVMEPFDKAYYDFGELTEDVEAAVEAYCQEKNGEAVKISLLTEEDGMAVLRMEYRSVEDYAEFNDVLLFFGTFSEAVAAGYVPDELYDTEGQYAEVDPEKQGNLKVIVTEESISIQTGGRIKYVSDNVTVLDGKLARAVEAGKNHPAFVLYK